MLDYPASKRCSNFIGSILIQLLLKLQSKFFAIISAMYQCLLKAFFCMWISELFQDFCLSFPKS